MLKKGLILLTFLFSLLGVIFLIERALVDADPFGALIVTSFFYTTQSNVLVFIVVSLYVLKLRDSRLFEILAFIAAVDISITGIVYNLFLTSYVTEMDFMQRLLHIYVPILYVAFYVIIINTKLRFSNLLLVLIHPLLFLMSVYLLVLPHFTGLFRQIYWGLERPEYIYPFLDPNNYDRGSTDVFLFGTFVITPLFIVLGIIFIRVKGKLSRA